MTSSTPSLTAALTNLISAIQASADHPAVEIANAIGDALDPHEIEPILGHLARHADVSISYYTRTDVAWAFGFDSGDDVPADLWDAVQMSRCWDESSWAEAGTDIRSLGEQLQDDDRAAAIVERYEQTGGLLSRLGEATGILTADIEAISLRRVVSTGEVVHVVIDHGADRPLYVYPPTSATDRRVIDVWEAAIALTDTLFADREHDLAPDEDRVEWTWTPPAGAWAAS